MNLTCAIAVSEDQHLEPQHFGEAAHFILAKMEGNGIRVLETLKNPFRGHHGQGDHDHQHGHGAGHGKKAGDLIALLGEKGVQVLVSTQYGPNIRRVCQHFVPVMAPAVSLEEIKALLLEHSAAIAADWTDHSGWHTIIRIQEGGELLYIEVKH